MKEMYNDIIKQSNKFIETRLEGVKKHQSEREQNEKKLAEALEVIKKIDEGEDLSIAQYTKAYTLEKVCSGRLEKLNARAKEYRGDLNRLYNTATLNDTVGMKDSIRSIQEAMYNSSIDGIREKVTELLGVVESVSNDINYGNGIKREIDVKIEYNVTGIMPYNSINSFDDLDKLRTALKVFMGVPESEINRLRHNTLEHMEGLQVLEG